MDLIELLNSLNNFLAPLLIYFIFVIKLLGWFLLFIALQLLAFLFS